jgi:type III pantothenate kinase
VNTIASQSLIAVVVGNTSLRLGYFEIVQPVGLPIPKFDLRLSSRQPDFRALADQLPSRATAWYVASVFREAEMRLRQWAETNRPLDPYRNLEPRDFPLHIEVDQPERVGTDRLAGAVAANRLRMPDRGAIVVDAGTAITVNAVSADGAFLGGAILPSLDMASTALSEQTDLLPLVRNHAPGKPPPALGQSTTAAIRSGLFWGTVGAIHELINKLSQTFPTPPDLFFTGGGMRELMQQVGCNAQFVPHLVLSGIALTAKQTKDEGRRTKDEGGWPG